MGATQQALIHGGDPYWNSVVLLAFQDNQASGGTSFVDQSKYGRTLTATAPAQWTNGSAPSFLATSLLGDGLTASVGAASSSDFAFGTGDLTVEWFMRTTDLSINRTVLSFLSTGTTEIAVHIYVGTSGLRLYINGSDVITNNGSLSTNTWYHCAYSRVSGTGKMFLNGTQSGSNYSDSNNYGNKPFRAMDYETPPVGAHDTWKGQQAAIRVTKGVGRYSGTFTPPVPPFPIG